MRRGEQRREGAKSAKGAAKRGRGWLWCWLLLLGAGLALGVRAGESPTTRGLVVLKENCFSCHDEEKKKGGLVLTSREGVLRGGDEGKVVVVGKAGESRLIEVLKEEADPHMPPKKQLAEAEVAALRAWIDGGAVWDEKALAEKPAARGVELREMPRAYRPVMAVTLSPDGKKLAAGRGSQVVVYEVGGEKPVVVTRKEVGRDVVSALAWSGDGERLVGGTYGKVVVWETKGWEVAGEWGGFEGRVTALCAAGKDRVVAADGVTGKSGRISVFRIGEASPVKQWGGHDDLIYSIVADATGGVLYTAGADKLVKGWSLSDGVEKSRLEGHPGHVFGLAMKKDGLVLASGGVGGEARVWDLKTKERKMLVERLPGAVTAMGWAGEGKSYVVACEEGSVRVYPEDRQQPEKTFKAAGDIVYCLAASGDGKLVYGGCHDGAVYVWQVADGSIVTKLSE